MSSFLAVVKKKVEQGIEKVQEAASEERGVIGADIPPTNVSLHTARHRPAGSPLRILSIDGGGIRGLVPLVALEKIEEKTGKLLGDMFDLICGTSTGGIIALALTEANIKVGRPLKASEIIQLYLSLVDSVFTRGLIAMAASSTVHSAKYSKTAVTNALKEEFGDKDITKHSIGPRAFCVSVIAHTEITTEDHEDLFIFRNHAAIDKGDLPGTNNCKIWSALRATSAAPGYFAQLKSSDNPPREFIDGGVGYNNPTELGVFSCRKRWPDLPISLIVSLGTGRHPDISQSSKLALANTVGFVIAAATATQAVHNRIRREVTTGGILEGAKYFRWNPLLHANITLDETDKSTLKTMRDYALHQLNSSDFDKVCDLLKTDSDIAHFAKQANDHKDTTPSELPQLRRRISFEASWN